MAKKTETIKTEMTNNNVIERVTEKTYNALKNAGVNMEGYAIVNHRIKTDAKLEAMEQQNPEMYKAFCEIKELHTEIVKERFTALGKKWKITVTIKNDGDE
jgi:sulfite reductase beta subunit-like hemoprotein